MIPFRNDVWAKLTQATKEEVTQAKEILGYSPKGVRYSTKFKEGKWDGTLSLIKYPVFPAGLIPYLKENYPGTIELIDHRPSPSVVDSR